MLGTACIRTVSARAGQPGGTQRVHPGSIQLVGDPLGQPHLGRPADTCCRRSRPLSLPRDSTQPAMASVMVRRCLYQLGSERWTILVHRMPRPPRSLAVSSLGAGASGEVSLRRWVQEVARTALLHFQPLQARQNTVITFITRSSTEPVPYRALNRFATSQKASEYLITDWTASEHQMLTLAWHLKRVHRFHNEGLFVPGVLSCCFATPLTNTLGSMIQFTLARGNWTTSSITESHVLLQNWFWTIFLGQVSPASIRQIVYPSTVPVQWQPVAVFGFRKPTVSPPIRNGTRSGH
jgi:hypothetical protein